jgi:hypothetical protein
MKLVTFTIAVLVFVSCSLAQAAGTPSKYIGYKYKGVTPSSILPNGVKHFGGSLIGDIEADPVYGISSVSIGKTNMFWLEVSTGRDDSGVTGWEVKDVIEFATLSKSDYIFFAGDPAIDCKRNSEVMENLVGVGKIVRKKGIFIPAKLWIANIETAKFESTPVAGVTCVYSEP